LINAGHEVIVNVPGYRPDACFIYRKSIDSHRNSMEGWVVGKLTVRALRAVLVVVLTGTVFVQASMVWVLVSGSDPEDGSLPLTAMRVITILGMAAAQVALVCVWRLVTMVRRGTVFSHAAFRYVDGVIGAIVAAALLWFAVTAVNAPGQRDDPGVTVIMGGIGLAILGVALIVLVLRMLLAQAVARDGEAAQMQAELDEVI
jgi:small-conductance mechanosensitive channel